MAWKNKADKKRYQRNWKKARRISWLKENGPCLCGETRISQLTVDHIDAETKEMEATDIWSRREEIRSKELSKCQVLCKTCHRKKTEGDGASEAQAEHYLNRYGPN